MGKNSRRHNMIDAEAQEHLTRLRNALVTAHGQDKDVTADVSPFMKYKRNGLDLDIQFSTKLAPSSVSKWALALTKDNMEKTYNESTYMWDDDDKRDELMRHQGAGRFLIVKDNAQEGKPVGFVHFRFTLQGEAVEVLGGEPAIYVMDIQLEKSVQRKGLGKHLMRTLEMIARKQLMMHVMVPVTVCDEVAKAFLLKGLNGFTVDNLAGVVSRDNGESAAEIYLRTVAEDGTFVVISKSLEAPRPAAQAPAATTPEKGLPTDADKSAANTPLKDTPDDPVQQAISFVQQQKYKEELGKFGDNVAAMKGGAAASAPALPVFDPTFGASPVAKKMDPAAAKLKAELIAYGAIPEGLDGEAEDMLLQLIELFKIKHNRAPTEEEVMKWVDTLRDAVAEGGLIGEEDESDEGDSDSGDDSAEDGSDDEA